MPLTFLSVGSRGQVLRLQGNDKIKRHLNNLGLVEGRILEVSSFDGTNYIIILDGTKYALNRDLAGRIFVKEVER